MPEILDLNTSLFFLLAFMVVDGITALLIWNSHRHMPGLAMIAGGFLTFSAAVWAMPASAVVLITVRNLLFNLSQVMVSEGMALFLNKPALPRALTAMAVFTLIFWPASQYFLPEPQSLPLRVIVACVIAMLGELRMAWLILRDRTQTRLWRVVTLISLCVLFAIMMTRLIQAATSSWTDMTTHSQAQAWFFFLTSIGVNFLFVCMLVMVGERLSHDLRDRNLTLSEEIEYRTQLQAKVSAALTEQLRLRDERRQFLHLLEHEIGTPLAIIDRSAEMIEAAPDTLATRLKTIRGAVRRLSRLTGDLMVAERISLDSLQLTPLDANEIAQEAIENFGGDIGLMIVPSDYPAKFIGDRDMMVMALTNLINNARKFSNAAHPVAIGIRQTQTEIQIAVEDRGIGFPDSEIGAIGQPRFRASNAQAISGNGLGLHIVSQILEMHCGRIEIANRDGGGAVVSLYIPAET